MHDLLSLLVPSILKERKSHKDEKVMKLIPKQFSPNINKDSVNQEEYNYYKTLSVIDFVSGMTDSYAANLHKELMSGNDILF